MYVKVTCVPESALHQYLGQTGCQEHMCKGKHPLSHLVWHWQLPLDSHSFDVHELCYLHVCVPGFSRKKWPQLLQADLDQDAEQLVCLLPRQELL